jgi:5-methylcytosine-specific restriction protein A
MTTRRWCLAHHGARCSVCGFDFGAVYGERGEGYIHVHHLVPLAMITEATAVDPVRDLRPVCPNCHAMLHRYPGAPCTLEELQQIMAQARPQGPAA